MVNAVDLGWVPTKMGVLCASDDLHKGYEIQVWLAVTNDEKAKVTSRYFYYQTIKPDNTSANDTELQSKFIII